MGTNFLGTNSGLLSKAWEASRDAYNSREPFTVKSRADGVFVLITFPGCGDIQDIVTDTKFGECEINKGNQFFRSLKHSTTNQPGLVHEGFLNRFLRLLEGTSDFEKKVQNAQRENKIIVFCGHSVGGAVATLATLWVLEKRQAYNPPFCLTFGSPLVGDGTLAQAVRRERWAGQFYHFVLRHDIVPRILFAPWKSISEAFQHLLPCWWYSMRKSGLGHAANGVGVQARPLSAQDRCELLRTVMQHVSAVASYNSAASMAPTSMLLNGISSVVKQSPYRPFGCYVFCSASGPVCTENHEAVLQMLYYSLQTSDPLLLRTADACISEHTEYGSILTTVSQNIVAAGDLGKLGIYKDANSNSPCEVGISEQLEALGLGIQNIQARLALQAAGEVERRLRNNSAKKSEELSSNAQGSMEEMESYKKSCKVVGVGYYDSFKQQKEKKDFQANLARLRLAGFWDEIKDMMERNELPDDFETEAKWIEAGTAYRRLVEPVDIANYYRLGKHEDTGHYLSKGRPRRYTIVEQWLEAQQQRRGSSTPMASLIHRSDQPVANLTTDSRFWAYLEELSYSLSKLEAGQELSLEDKSKHESFEKLVRNLIANKEISQDVFLEESSFIKWWKMLTYEVKARSPLWEFMEGGGRKRYCTTVVA